MLSERKSGGLQNIAWNGNAFFVIPSFFWFSRAIETPYLSAVSEVLI
jgi:hypothetical protein